MKCDYCGKNAHYKCAICNKYICTNHSKLAISCKKHLLKKEKIEVKIRQAIPADKKVIEEIEDSLILEHEKKVDEERWKKCGVV